MACGIPCVVTNVGDSALLVGNSGLVVPCQDPVALAEALCRLICLDPAEKRLLGARARLRIETQFSLDVIVNRYQQLYLDVLK
jgi:glycosyltransferase involved in cell wall biosynthesis